MAERALATAYVNIVPGTQAVEQYLKGGIANTASESGTTAGGKFTKNFGGKVKGMIGGLGLAFGAIGVVNFTKDLIAAGEAERAGNQRLENIADSMGIFGDQSDIVAGRLENLSGVLQTQLGIDDDVIKSTQAKLLTFKEIATTADVAGGAFDRATQASLDLAAAGFGSAESNAVQLGKALQDPVKGLGSLSRAGVTFTADEKNRIKTLVESNKMGEAQALVLSAIETQVGGTAEASATSSDKMAQGYAQVQESLGLMLMPALDSLATFLNGTVFPAVQDFITAFQNGETPLNTFIDGLTGVYNWIVANYDWLSPFAIALGTLVAIWQGYNLAMRIWQTVTTIATGIQFAFNAVLAMNPIMLVVIAIAALTAGLVWFFTKTELGQKIWKTLTDFFMSSMSAVGDFFTDVWNGISSAWKTLTDFLMSSMRAVGDFLTDVWNGISSAFSTVFDSISGAFKGYVNIWIGLLNFIIDALNTIHIDIPDWVPGIGGQKWGVQIPNVPMLAKGGFVTGPTQAIIGEAGPEVVTPLKDFERMMGLTEGKGNRPIYADGIGLIGMIRETAKGQAELVFNNELGKAMRGTR